jgi:hypothetical protein
MAGAAFITLQLFVVRLFIPVTFFLISNNEKKISS